MRTLGCKSQAWHVLWKEGKYLLLHVFNHLPVKEDVALVSQQSSFHLLQHSHVCYVHWDQACHLLQNEILVGELGCRRLTYKACMIAQLGLFSWKFCSVVVSPWFLFVSVQWPAAHSPLLFLVLGLQLPWIEGLSWKLKARESMWSDCSTYKCAVKANKISLKDI